MKKILLGFSLLFASQGFSATFITDNFDTGTASSDWWRNNTVDILAGGPTGSSHYANVIGTSDNLAGLGDRVEGADNFVIDFYFQVQAAASTIRQFNIGVSTASANPNAGAATINLRIQNNSFAIYNGSSETWSAVAGMGTISPDSWYRMQIEGTGWGAPGASYALRLFAEDGTTALGSASGLTTVQNGSITGSFNYGSVVQDGTLKSFLFSTTYGDNPGFNVDNVVVTGTLVPEPSSIMLGAGAAALLLRRRRR